MFVIVVRNIIKEKKASDHKWLYGTKPDRVAKNFWILSEQMSARQALHMLGPRRLGEGNLTLKQRAPARGWGDRSRIVTNQSLGTTASLHHFVIRYSVFDIRPARNSITKSQ
jgi:hypothetical protein